MISPRLTYGGGHFFAQARCKGDVHIDDHHTSEDVAITVGQCLAEALGTKAGCVRMGWAEGSCGEARVLLCMDLSNRPYFEHDLRPPGEMAGDMSVEMLLHVFDSLATSARMTVHVLQLAVGRAEDAALDLALATAQAFGLALRQTAAIDPRRGGATASSKGTLSA
jgi:imidazoleglycerol-phosphate dehydratase